jgi:hypothetical protein
MITRPPERLVLFRRAGILMDFTDSEFMRSRGFWGGFSGVMG